MARILLIDDEPNILRSLGTFLEQRGHRVATAPRPDSAMEECSRHRPELVILDVRLGRDDGLTLLPELRRRLPDSPVIMISGHADIPLAVRALQAGAHDFLEKPIDTERLLVAIDHALRTRRLQDEINALVGTWKSQNLFVGDSPAFQACLAQLERAAGSELNLLIDGPNGCGKEILARWAHLNSQRSSKALICVNCAAVPHDLAESQFFGHVKGAFTGATADHPGHFVQADGGTLFLDEIGELSAGLQAKLLRAIERGEIQAVGGGATIQVSVRLIAATNRDLAALVRAGRFREDLYYRLNQVPIHVPGLSGRREDIAGMVAFMLANQGLDPATIDRSGLDWLAAQAWPGNVRELKNLLARALVLCPARPIAAADLAALSGTVPGQPMPDGPARAADDTIWRQSMPLREARQRLERQYLETQLTLHGGSVRRTAEALDILPNNLSRRLGELGIGSRNQSADS